MFMFSAVIPTMAVWSAGPTRLSQFDFSPGALSMRFESGSQVGNSE